jgi:hypothetical protein
MGTFPGILVKAEDIDFFVACVLHVSVEKESIDEREKRERAVREKEAQEEAERKLKEKNAAGSLLEEGNTADQQPTTGEEVRFCDLRRPVVLAVC